MKEERTGGYVHRKASGTAKEICTRYDVDFPEALRMTERLWSEARSVILKNLGSEEWGSLTLGEKSEVCRDVVKALLDRRRVEGFLSGGSRLVG